MKYGFRSCVREAVERCATHVATVASLRNRCTLGHGIGQQTGSEGSRSQEDSLVFVPRRGLPSGSAKEGRQNCDEQRLCGGLHTSYSAPGCVEEVNMVKRVQEFGKRHR